MQDVIEGNVILALQLGLHIPQIEGVEIKEIDYAETEAVKAAEVTAVITPLVGVS